jgi:16S rRNA (guanine527-N7)-methyltransferase
MPSPAERRLVERILASPHNLTALRTPELAYVELVADALAGLEVVGSLPGDVIDVGSGAGVPGLPLALALPERRFVLMDANRKKTSFVEETAALFGLSRVDVRTMRAEEAGRATDMREHFGVALAKALAPLAVLVEWLIPLIQPEGRAVCWKGPAAPSEIEQASGALARLAAEVERVIPYRLEGREERSLVVLRRTGPLDAAMPRRVGVASRKPL